MAMKILIAEDDDIIQNLNQKLMHHWGYEYDLAYNGKEAVEYAQNNIDQYDICLMDIDVPIMNGLNAAKRIREKVRYFPIIAISANQEHKNKCFQIGIDKFLKKPCHPDKLYQKLNDFNVKLFKFKHQDKKILMEEEKPMNQEELNELRKLKKMGLTKLKLIGTDYSFIVHKNVQNKISHDLVGQSKELAEFIDRSEAEPGRCHLYKANLHVTKDLFIPDELEKAIQEEDQIMSNFNKYFDVKLSQND